MKPSRRLCNIIDRFLQAYLICDWLLSFWLIQESHLCSWYLGLGYLIYLCSRNSFKVTIHLDLCFVLHNQSECDILNIYTHLFLLSPSTESQIYYNLHQYYCIYTPSIFLPKLKLGGRFKNVRFTYDFMNHFTCKNSEELTGDWIEFVSLDSYLPLVPELVLIWSFSAGLELQHGACGRVLVTLWGADEGIWGPTCFCLTVWWRGDPLTGCLPRDLYVG